MALAARRRLDTGICSGQFVSARDRHPIDDDVRMFVALATRYGREHRCVGLQRGVRLRAAGKCDPLFARGSNRRGLEGSGARLGSNCRRSISEQHREPPFAEDTSGHSAFSAAAASSSRASPAARGVERSPCCERRCCTTNRNSRTGSPARTHATVIARWWTLLKGAL
jgi:hypothetical protein